MEYELYHDESQEDGYWHGMLVVPVERKQMLVDLLEQARENTRYSDPLGIKGVRRHNRVYNCACAWVQIGVGFLRSRPKGEPYPLFLGKLAEGGKTYELLGPDCVGAKFVLFCERDSHQAMSGYPDHASRIETTFRMGMKGGLHFLGSEEAPIRIERMHFDGHAHHQRHIDRSRVVGRLAGLREYCSVDDRDDLIDDRSSDHRRADSQDYEDCQLLQLTDLLIGCFRTALGHQTRDLHRELALPIRAIIERYCEGYARMQNSRWWRSFCMSRCYLASGQWKFETIYSEKAQKGMQMELPLV